MKPLIERVKDRVRDAICKPCIYRTAQNTCSLGSEENCAILDSLPRIIEIVRTTDSPTIDPYVQKLREVVCADCRNEDERGRCRKRAHNDCALDDYFLLLVEIVEQELDEERLSKRR